MTNKEASKVLEHIKFNENYELYIDKEDVEALTLAIKALEECANNAQGDLISRSALRARYQAILDRGDMFCEYDIIGMVDNAPTVEPTSGLFKEMLCAECDKRPQGEGASHET